MHIQHYTNAQYDGLACCPFCDGDGLMFSGDDCPHFVAGFQDGDWDPDLIPPVFCDGFRYQRNPLTRALTQSVGIVCKIKPSSARHPRIEAYFCLDQDQAAEFRKRFLRTVIAGAECHTCGNETAVVLEEDEIVCALCGSTAEPAAP